MGRELTVTLQGVEFKVTVQDGQPVVVCPDGEVLGPGGVFETDEGLVTGAEIIAAARAATA